MGEEGEMLLWLSREIVRGSAPLPSSLSHSPPSATLSIHWGIEELSVKSVSEWKLQLEREEKKGRKE